MKRNLSLLTLSLLAIGGAWAASLSPEEALQRVKSSGVLPATRALDASTLEMTLQAPDGDASLYVFNQPEAGFLVVSAEDATLPLLGYSDSGNFDPDNVPPALQGWLDNYQEQIVYARANGLTEGGPSTKSITLPSWAPIAPMLKTTWDQGEPYNIYCPKINGKSCPTGCVATAMSQVMNYFQYPDTGQGYISYQINAGTSQVPIYQTLTLNLANVTFDWNNMLDSYSNDYNEEQADAVATLMQAAGYSVQMNYGTAQSGAVSGYIPGALANNFGYDPSVMFVSRSMKNYTEWATLIYNNLKNVGPVIYDGDTAFMGGHSFVCDGYQGNGYFHFNWGWSGLSDGYFLLDALNPAALGTGGAEGGFNFRQDVVINIQKPKAGSKPTPDQVVLSGSLYGTASSAYLYMRIKNSEYSGFRYYGNSEVVFTLGAQIEEADNPNATPQYFEVANSIFRDYKLDPGYVCFCNGSGQYPFPMVQLSKLGLKENVRYKVTAAYKTDDSDWQPTPASEGYYNYYYVTKNGTKYEFENFDVMEFDCTKLEILNPLYNGVGAKMNLSLVNNNDQELTRGVIFMLIDENENIAFYGDSFSLSLAPGESYSTEWTTALVRLNAPNKFPAQYYPALYDLDSDTFYYKADEPLTMNANPGNPIYDCTITIDNEELIGGVYQVKNSQDINVTTTINVTSGIFSKNLALYVMRQQGNSLFGVVSYPLDIQVIQAGESYTYHTNLNFSTANVGESYYLGPCIEENSSIQLMVQYPPQFKVLGNFSDIESIIAENGELTFFHNSGAKTLDILGGVNGVKSVEAYYLNGVKAPLNVEYYGESAHADLSVLGKGIVIVTAVDDNGNRKSVKLAL